MLRLLRSVFAVFIGLILISLLVESIEFGLVAFFNGGLPPTDDAHAYGAIRNQPVILSLKVVYTILGAMAGGYVAAWIAGENRNHGIALALIQTIAMVWGMFFSELGEITPVWMRITLVIITAPAIVTGGLLRKSPSRQEKSTVFDSK